MTNKLRAVSPGRGGASSLRGGQIVITSYRLPRKYIRIGLSCCCVASVLAAARPLKFIPEELGCLQIEVLTAVTMMLWSVGDVYRRFRL
jgi:hypothetical protein